MISFNSYAISYQDWLLDSLVSFVFKWSVGRMNARMLSSDWLRLFQKWFIVNKTDLLVAGMSRSNKTYLWFNFINGYVKFRFSDIIVLTVLQQRISQLFVWIVLFKNYLAWLIWYYTSSVKFLQFPAPQKSKFTNRYCGLMKFFSQFRFGKSCTSVNYLCNLHLAEQEYLVLTAA